jgi:hypothetical protein
MEKKKKDFWINYNGKWIKNPSKWLMLRRDFKFWCKKWKLVDKSKNKIIPQSEMKRYFSLSPKELESAEKIFKEKGTLEYIFYPTGISWGVRVHTLKTGEIIDITDVSCW